MNLQSLPKLMLELSSDDLVVSHHAQEELFNILAPQNICNAFRSSNERSELYALLDEVNSVKNKDVLKLIDKVLHKALSCDEYSSAIIANDEKNALCKFVISILSDDEVDVAMTISRSVVLLLLTKMEETHKVDEICDLLDECFSNEKILRLFDCDYPLSEENAQVYRLLHNHSKLINVIIDLTLKCYTSHDLLLLSNYLIACSIIARYESINETLLAKVNDALVNRYDDVLIFTFTCNFCQNVIYEHETNAERYAEAWVEIIASPLPTTHDSQLIDATCSLIGAASTTRNGWVCVESRVPSSWVQQLIMCSTNTIRLASLDLLITLLHSTAVPDSFFTSSLIQSVWQLRQLPEADVKVKVWKVMTAFVYKSNFVNVVAPFCASYLCGQLTYDEPEVRAVQLRVAQLLIDRATVLPANTKRSLERVIRSSVYPAGSAGVALLKKR